MKMPKITEGEWSDWFGHVKSGSKSIADCDTVLGEETPETIEANAKAISAVPEMIDALVEVQHAIDECRLDNGGVALGDVLEEKVKSAIIKAGCTS